MASHRPDCKLCHVTRPANVTVNPKYLCPRHQVMTLPPLPPPKESRNDR